MCGRWVGDFGVCLSQTLYRPPRCSLSLSVSSFSEGAWAFLGTYICMFVCIHIYQHARHQWLVGFFTTPRHSSRRDSRRDWTRRRRRPTLHCRGQSVGGTAGWLSGWRGAVWHMCLEKVKVLCAGRRPLTSSVLVCVRLCACEWMGSGGRCMDVWTSGKDTVWRQEGGRKAKTRQPRGRKERRGREGRLGRHGGRRAGRRAGVWWDSTNRDLL